MDAQLANSKRTAPVLLRWAVAGLVGPVLIGGGAYLGLEGLWPLGVVLAIFFPTWLFGWLVMGGESTAIGYAIFAATVLGNVAVFVFVGMVSQRFARLDRIRRWVATAGVYVVAYTVVMLVAYQLL